jgi:hypothetical protein
MAELIDVANAMFKDKHNWKNIIDDDKEKFFFIFNRYFSKKYPVKSQLLNNKTIDKVTALNLWYYFNLDKPYPKWFWSKSSKSIKSDIDEKDFELLMKKLNLNKPEDLIYLLNNYTEIINEELKFYKTKNK